MRYLIVFLAFLTVASAQNIRPITQVNDVNRVGDEYYTKPVTWFAGDSIRFDVLARDGRTPLNFSGAFPVLFVAAETNLSQVYIVATGSVVSATNGHVSVPVQAEAALLDPARAYSAWVTVFNVAAPTQEIATVAYSAVTVKGSPLGTEYDYLTNGVAPWSIEVGTVEVAPEAWSQYPATQPVDVAGNVVTNAGKIYGDASGLSNFPASVASSAAVGALSGAVETVEADLQGQIDALPDGGEVSNIVQELAYPLASGEAASNKAATAFGWGDHAAAGYALQAASTSYYPKTGGALSGSLSLGLGRAVVTPTIQGVNRPEGSPNSDLIVRGGALITGSGGRGGKVIIDGGGTTGASGATGVVIIANRTIFDGYSLTHIGPIRIADENTNSVVTITATGGLQVGSASFHAELSGDIWHDPTNTAVLGIITAQSITSGAYYGRGDTLQGVATGTPIYSIAGLATGTPIYSIAGLATGTPLYELGFDISNYATGAPLYEVDLTPYATGTPVYSLAGLATGTPLYTIDLTPYATGTPVYSVAGLATGSPLYEVDLSGYATGTPIYTVSGLATGTPIYSVAGLATGSPLYEIDLSGYATGTPVYSVSGLATGTPIYSLAGLATGTPLYEIDLTPYATGTPIYSVAGLATGSPLYEIDLSAYATGTPVYSVSGLATGTPLYEVDLTPYATGTPIYSVAGMATGSPLYEVDLTPYATGTPIYALGFDIADYAGTGTVADLQATVTALGTATLTQVDAAATYATKAEYDASITNVTAVNSLRLGNSLPAAFVRYTDWQADMTNNVRQQSAYPTNVTAAGTIGSIVLVSLGGGTNELWVYGAHALGTNTPGWARFQGVAP